jgi:hypothetical protein
VVYQIYHGGDYGHNGYGFFLSVINHPRNSRAGISVRNVRPLIHMHFIGIGNSDSRGHQLLENRLRVCPPEGSECLKAYSCLFAVGTLAVM